MLQGVKRFPRKLVLTLGSAAVVLLLAVAALADIHPVPLDKNVDGAKCLECHTDKAQGKNVHTAVSTGCLSCHEVRVNRDTTRVKLITSTTSSLCLSCHADKNAAEIKGHVHPPAVRDCIKCHDPHQSDFKNQLKKDESGGAKENLCLSCHTIGLNTPEKGSRHIALDMGCNTCHTTHKTGEAGNPVNDYHLTKAAPALCVDCHDPKDEGLQKAHQNQPFATANCVQCHDPHQSAQPKLMAKYTHPPFAEKSCEVCHAPAKDGKVVLTAADAKSVCVICHSDKAEAIEKAKVQHPGAAGDCTDCHNPHASRQPGLPKTNGVEICLGCHADIADLQKKKAVHHQPVFGEACGTCHNAHGGDNEHLLRATGNKLCLECHGPESTSTYDKASDTFKLFDGTAKVRGDYFKKNKVPVLPLKYGKGHPVEGHPINDVPDPLDPKKIFMKVSCQSCHQPHAGAYPGMLVNDQKNGTMFCASCHKDLRRQ